MRRAYGSAHPFPCPPLHLNLARPMLVCCCGARPLLVVVLLHACCLCVAYLVCLCVRQVLFHYYVDRVRQCDVERVASLTPLIASKLSKQSQSVSGGVRAGAASLSGFVARWCVELLVAVRHSGFELCKRRSAVTEPLFALLTGAVSAWLTRFTPHANELAWTAWQQCKPALLEQQLQQQADGIEQSVRRQLDVN